MAIPPALVDWLDRLFPERSPDVSESHGDMMFRGGQTSVVRFLKHKLKEQTEGD
jgi:hypothetical protein